MRVAVAGLLLLALGRYDSGRPLFLVPREEAIPADAVKMSPATDPWPTILHSDEWEPSQNLGPVINTAADEGWPFLSEDGTELWFTRSSYEGQATPGPASFRSRMLPNGEWDEPELILSQFAGEPALDREGNLYFVHHYFTGTDPIRMIEADSYFCRRRQ